MADWWVMEFIRMNGQTSQHLQNTKSFFFLYFDNQTEYIKKTT